MNNRGTLLFLFCLILPGCGGLTSKQPPPTLYNLLPAAAGTAMPAIEGARPLVLAIPEPQLPPALEGSRIIVFLDGGRRTDHAAAARWTAPLEDMLRDVVVQTARENLPGVLVNSGDVKLQPRYRLAVEVLDFQPVYETGPVAAPQLHAALIFTLVDMKDNSIATSFTLRQAQRAAANDMPSVTGGLERLLQDLLTDAFSRIGGVMASG